MALVFGCVAWVSFGYFVVEFNIVGAAIEDTQREGDCVVAAHGEAGDGLMEVDDDLAIESEQQIHVFHFGHLTPCQ